MLIAVHESTYNSTFHNMSDHFRRSCDKRERERERVHTRYGSFFLKFFKVSEFYVLQGEMDFTKMSGKYQGTLNFPVCIK